jgi:2'-5' RNA ligase
MCRAKACCRTTFPVPVFLNRLDAPLWVLSLGMNIFPGNQNSTTNGAVRLSGLAVPGSCRAQLSARTIDTEMELSRDGQSLAAEQTVGHFALVSYIPDPLARFLDDLRLELTPGSKPRAHVTILPPRPLHDELAPTIRQMSENLRRATPFRVELGKIEIFEASHVIYLSLASGGAELRRLYSLVNCGCLEYAEMFPYHPHITIAQNILPEDVERMAAHARQKWKNYAGPRDFTVSSLSFVQHVALSIWTDVATLPLGVEVGVGS